MPTAFSLAANATAAFLPRTYKASVSREFTRPRVRKQTDKGRDWLDSLNKDTFEGPKGRQRVYRGGDGPLVFFQHGWEADSADLSTLGEAVMSAGFSVALIDGPSHGESEGHSAYILPFAEGLGAAAAQLGQPYGVVAHSMGLPASVLAMTRHGLKPDRVVGLGAPDALTRNAAFQSEAMGLSRRAIALMIEAMSESLGEPAANMDITLDAPNLTIPALILHGANDQIAPPVSAERITSAWPDARSEIFDGVGHRGILRDPRVVEQVLGFLTADTPTS
ncbi:alpha/beta fold hydrolase [Oceanicaulis sp. LC35]|uniref:alpha/beta fold hydrolase n=1 Tax=Oceanicaulis sp. LC35 TaxID=3349635 RepID=UPI003F82BD37